MLNFLWKEQMSALCNSNILRARNAASKLRLVSLHVEDLSVDGSIILILILKK